MRLHALPGPVIPEPRDGVLWAQTSPIAKGLVETSPSESLHIYSHFVPAGA